MRAIVRSRRLGSAVSHGVAINEPVPEVEPLRLLSILERAELASEFDVVAQELAIVEALVGWRDVLARSEQVPEPVALEAAGTAQDAEPPRWQLVVDRTRLHQCLAQSLGLPARHLAVEALAAG